VLVKLRGKTLPLVAAISIVCTSSSPSAFAGSADDDRCVASAERGQRERDEGRLVESRVLFSSCGGPSCPIVVQRDCLRWLAEVNARIPSIVVSVKDPADKDIVDGEIFVDGRPLAAANRGREHLVDPGKHLVVAKRAGWSDTSEEIVVGERERGRNVRLVMTGHVASPEQPARLVRPAARRVPMLTWILGGAAFVAGGSWAYLHVRATDETDTLRATCGLSCPKDAVDDAFFLVDASYVSLGIGVAAALGATLVYLLGSASSATQDVSLSLPQSVRF
jgi:hypothetical protein